MSDEQSAENIKIPCRHCGEPTAQRVKGIPYCSMDCIGMRRLEKKKEQVVCTYPGCDWQTDYLPGNGLSETVASREIEKHRESHWPELVA